jgi:hypothetical protein
VPGYHAHLLAFNLASERGLRLPEHDPLSQRGLHPLSVIRVEVEFLGNLLVRQVQARKESTKTQTRSDWGQRGPSGQRSGRTTS